jgi:hypothetical protein
MWGDPLDPWLGHVRIERGALVGWIAHPPRWLGIDHTRGERGLQHG